MVVKVDKVINCTVIGDAMTGKSTLVKTFIDTIIPDDNYAATILETYEDRLNIDGQKIRLNILDNAGQHDYNSMRTTGYKNNTIIALCYSVADRDSFKNIKDFWIPELNDSNCNRKPLILVATKTDLRTDNRDYVSTVEGEILSKEIGAERFIECSAFYKDSVHTVFHFIATASPQYKKKRSVTYRIIRR